MPTTVAAEDVAAIRDFNRFYTREIGMLKDGILNSRYPLTEVRVLYELAHRRSPLASDIGAELALDPGYLSRIVERFARRGWITRSRSGTDARKLHLTLTAKGHEVFASLDKLAHREMAQLLTPLNSAEQKRLRANLEEARQLLGREKQTARAEIELTPAGPGDIGWVIQRHGALYAQEYGWNQEFEALVAEICAQFLRTHDPERECCWIARRSGAPVGMIMLVKDSAEVARLRLLLVEPSARGLGVGKRLIDECLNFARAAGYGSIKLWTQSILTAARKLYEAAGFELIETKPHTSFGARLHGETWELVFQGKKRAAKRQRR